MDSKFRKLTKAFEYIKTRGLYVNIKFDDYLLWANLARFHDKSILGSYLKEGFYHVPGFARFIANSFKPYQTQRQFWKDLLQPLERLFINIPIALFYLTINLIAFPFKLITLPFKLIYEIIILPLVGSSLFNIENSKAKDVMTPYQLTTKEAIQYYLVKSLDYLGITTIFNKGILGTLRGLLELSATPFILLLRIPIRAIRGYYTKKSAAYEKPVIQEYNKIIEEDIKKGQKQEDTLIITLDGNKLSIWDSLCHVFDGKNTKASLVALFVIADIYEMTRKWKNAIDGGYKQDTNDKSIDAYIEGKGEKNIKNLFTKQLSELGITPGSDKSTSLLQELEKLNYSTDVIKFDEFYNDFMLSIPAIYSLEKNNDEIKLITPMQNKIAWDRFKDYNNMFAKEQTR